MRLPQLAAYHLLGQHAIVHVAAVALCWVVTWRCVFIAFCVVRTIIIICSIGNICSSLVVKVVEGVLASEFVDESHDVGVHGVGN